MKYTKKNPAPTGQGRGSLLPAVNKAILFFSLLLLTFAYLPAAFSDSLSYLQSHSSYRLSYFEEGYSFSPVYNDGSVMIQSPWHAAGTIKKVNLRFGIKAYPINNLFFYEPYLEIETSRNAGDFANLYVVNNENRYLFLASHIESSSQNYFSKFVIGTHLFEALNEIALSAYPLYLSSALSESSSGQFLLTASDQAWIGSFVSALQSSGITEALNDDASRFVLFTQFNPL